MGVNSVTLVGRAGRDPEVRYFESGSMVANLTMAVNRRSRDDEPDWFNLEIWGKQAQVAADYVKKGSLIGIDLQGFIRTKNAENVLINSAWEEKKQALALTHYLKADGVEAEFLTGESNLTAAAKILESYGPKEVIITHKDGVLVYADGQIYEEPFKLKKVIVI